MKSYVIIGNGITGTTAADAIRELDRQGKITIITDEEYSFYPRKGLSLFMTGEIKEDDLFEKEDFYIDNEIELVQSGAKGIDTIKNKVILGNGNKVKYDKLLIATGARPIIPKSAEPNDATRLVPLYTLNDAKKILSLAVDSERVAIVGSSFFTFYLVPLLQKLGLNVDLIVSEDILWSDTFDEQGSELLEDIFKEEEVRILKNKRIRKIIDDSRKEKIRIVLENGDTLSYDFAVPALGLKPNIDMLTDSGINIMEGIIVDKFLRTNIENVFAAGSVAQIQDVIFKKPLLHQTWFFSREQGDCAGYNMVGKNRPYKNITKSHLISLYDLEIIVAGKTNIEHIREYEVFSHINYEERTYKKFILKNNLLMGALIIQRGWRGAEILSTLDKIITNFIDMSSWKEQLIRSDFALEDVLLHFEWGSLE
ncbi:MAG: NAD(P)/FAD-dependent oxidoreductase [Candidatus Odinarchaeota archaeon]|nr:NAD(P)/FAD-dependent oxidoreductase [Candidatus Odinarchaeota archaeon]